MDESSYLARSLFYGDNLYILRTYLSTASIDLIYLDPPFYSQRSYQALFKKGLSARTPQKVEAFLDIWHWNPQVEQSYHSLLTQVAEPVARVLQALQMMLGYSSLLAYLVMMAERLVELHRVLRSTGSVYLHCDPGASHYLKLLMDAVFGPLNFRNEIVWFYKTGGASRRHFSRKHDLIFFYSKSEDYTFHPQKEKSYMMHRYGFKKSTFLNDAHGHYTWVYMKDVWDIPALGAADGQRLGYPTQKPEMLLERIIEASSNQGELVLDPFSGSGTTLAVAQRLGRHWLGIENHALGIAFQRYRLAQSFPDLDYTFSGGPRTLEEARHLAHTDVRHFRWWALALVAAIPVGNKEQEVCEPMTGGIHGIISESAGGQARRFVAVTVDPPFREYLQCLLQQLSAYSATSLLVISLEAFAHDLLDDTMRGLVTIKTIVDLL